MRTRTGPAWATARRILPSCGTWHSTSCRRMARRKRCAASFSGPDGTMPISPASLLYSEVQLPWFEASLIWLRGFLHRLGRETGQAEVAFEFADRLYKIRHFDRG